jgi:2-polyprenyl-6-methoxyphenol hydroxylase-like FAD-dependent oxidoreductase
VREFRKAGVLDDIVAAASVNHDGMAWRAPKGKLLGLVGLSGDFMVLLGQPVLAEIILRRLKEFANAKILFGCRYVGCEQGDGKVTVHLEEGVEKVPVSRKCRILVGADGGHSPVRKSLGIPLEGFTWEDFRFVAANVRYAPLDQSDWGTANLVVHPTDWSVVVKTDRGDVWRVATGEKWDEELGEVENQKKLTERYRRILPGELDAIEFLSVAAYKTHQRCAQRFLDGNVVLAGDSAHVSSRTPHRTGS